MALDEERLERMQEYGLTEYEARTYMALQDLEVATARDIANLSRVPRTKIYSVLDDLHEKQLVEIIPERPKKYEVVAFEAYLERFEEKYEKKLERIKEDKEELTKPPNQSANGIGEKAGSFNVLKGRKNVMNRTHEMIDRAEDEIVELGTEFSSVRMGYYLPALEERADEDDIDLRLACPVTDENEENVRDYDEVGEARHIDDKTPGSVMFVVDDKEVLICHYVPDDEHLFQGEDVAIWSDDKAIVRDMKNTILSRWEDGDPVGSRLEEIVQEGAQ
jgi:sugar-specific transcriptional regulator TrmB